VYSSFNTKGGKLDKKQAEIEAQKLFKKLDTNSDGQVCFEEFEAFFSKRAKQAAKVAAKRRAAGHEHVDYMNEDVHLSPKHGSPHGGAHSPLSTANREEAPIVPIDVSGGTVSGMCDQPEMSAAYRKFKELDVQDAKALGATELLVLAEFIFTNFSPTGKALLPAERQSEAEKLVRKLVKGEALVTWEEFSKCVTDKYMKKPEGAVAEAAPIEQQQPDILDAMSMFKKLDKDKDEMLSLEEMKELAVWVYTSFSNSGAQLDEAQVEIEAGKLIRKLDKDGDAGISFDEFVGYFEKKAVQAKKFANAKAKAAARRSSVDK
jgi:Ca2+-binding EF-hand superfamily protein